MKRRYASAVAVALVLFIGALPAAAACCFSTATSPAAASMHAAMPCCAPGSCNLTTPKNNRDHDVTLTATSSPVVPLQLVADVTPAATEPERAGFGRSIELTANEFSAPPPFLLHSQFRI